MPAEPGRVWGQQYPFERNHLQRSLSLLALGSVFSVSLIFLVHGDRPATLGVALIAAGVVSGLAAASRRRYAHEARRGFSVLRTRGGGFVFASALALVVVAGVVVALVLQ